MAVLTRVKPANDRFKKGKANGNCRRQFLIAKNTVIRLKKPKAAGQGLLQKKGE
jgi:hypothetical protein